MSVINSIPLIAAGDDGYQISRSVRLRTSAGGYFNRTPSSSGSTTQWTLSTWVKRGTLGTFTSIFSACITGNPYYQSVLAFDSSDRLWYYQFSNSSVYTVNVTSTAVFRDPSAWYHVVMKFDATTSSMIVWVNNQQVINSSSFSTTFRYINTTNTHYIGNYAYQSVGPGVYDGYLAEFNFIDGQALTPSSFGETDAVTGVWKPKKYAGTYGTNGFYLNFSDNSAATAAAIGKDSSGNGNNWTPNNISVTAGVTYDSMLDVPTPYADGGNGRGNYCVLNPLDKGGSATSSNGNIQFSGTGAGSIRSTIGMVSGKWYFESTFTATTGTAGISIGGTSMAAYTGSVANEWSYGQNGQKITGGSGSAYGATFTAGDVIGVAFDADAGTLTFYKNGTSQGVAFTGLTSGPYFFTVGDNQTGAGQSVNFGQRPFAYTPPTGFKALNTQNLPDATIKKGSAYFDVALHTGNGGTTNVTSLNFQPDLVWIKARSNAANHGIIDAVRGVAKQLSSSSTAAELDITDGMQSFNSNGFTVQNETDGYSLNTNGYTYADWCWKESVSAGFDIVTYTGTGVARTVAHSLGVAPKMVVTKRRDGVASWIVYHASAGNGFLLLENTAAYSSASTYWTAAPTSSVGPALTTNSEVNANGGTYVSYLFAEVAGFSKFGSYVGNGSTDGPFVYCGFRPRWIMIKRTDLVSNWTIIDTSMSPYNVTDAGLLPNSSGAQGTGAGYGAGYDILSNGFKARLVVPNEENVSGATHIYAAFAENPFKNSLAR